MNQPRNFRCRPSKSPVRPGGSGTIHRAAIFVVAAAIFSALTTQVGADDLSRLVRQLGAERFELRQQAQQQILDLWPQFHHELNALTVPVDEESLRRLELLRQRIGDLRRQELLARLLEEPLRPGSPELPLWNVYSSVVGDDLSARLLYREMLQQEPELLGLAAVRDPEYSAVLTRRLESLDRAIHIGHFYPGEEVTSGKIAVLLLLSLEDTQPAPAVLSNVFKNVVPLPDQPNEKEDDQESVPPAAHQHSMRRLLSAWCSSAYAVPATVRLSKGVKYELPEAIEPAREILMSRRSTLPERKDALLALAQLGKPEHLPDLEPWLRDATVVDDLRRRGTSIRQTQLRDLALLAAVRIMEQDPAEFGFDSLQVDREKSYSLNSIGFETEEARQQAWQHWRTWHQHHVRPELFDRLDAIEGVTL